MKIKISIALLSAMILFYASCKDKDVIIGEESPTPYTLETGNFPAPLINADNPLTVEGVALGRMLFYETMLSKDGSQACASCHIQKFAFSDTSRFSLGVRHLPGKRQAMGVFNMAWNTNEFFWDGRAHLLRDQSLKPIQDALEMDETLENVIAKLSASNVYPEKFKAAFGTSTINEKLISLALEQFMNSIVSNNSKYDAFLKDSTVFTESEKRGYVLFNTEYNEFFPDKSGADCAHCHGGYNFENDLYANNGLDNNANFKDSGRYKVTREVKDIAAFKIPSLRNIALTAPYMHDGRFKTLDEVVNHYNSEIKESNSLDQALRATANTGLRLTEQDKMDLVAFLKTLSDNSLTTDRKYSSPF
ncbi:MAG: c-type cytochrome [Flavobacteriales bacterium]|nr:c-type cytochrome [Flavobacteriales bacterium]